MLVLTGLSFVGLAIVGVAVALRRPAQIANTSSLTIAGSQFVRNGKRYQIISGAIHYPRVPRAYCRVTSIRVRIDGAASIAS